MKGKKDVTRRPLLTRTDVNQRNKWYRLKHKIEGRIGYFDHMLAMQPNAFKTHEVRTACDQAISSFTNLLIKLDSVGFNYINQREVGDISEAERNKRINKAIEKDEIYKSVYDEVKKWPKRKTHFEDIVCLVKEHEWLNNDLSTVFLDHLSTSAANSCIKRVEDRLWLQIHDSHKAGWFITFSTLTVNSEFYETLFMQKSDAWRNYIRKIKRRVGRKCYGSWRNAEKSGFEYFHFFAVTERGSQGRLHIHMMLFMKDIWFSDPTGADRTRQNRHIIDRTLFWPYGIEQHIAVRFSNDDAFGKRGWKWPRLMGLPIPMSKPIAIAQYLTKYLTESRNIQTTRETKSWKIKTNHLMGRTRLTRLIQACSSFQLEALVINKIYPIPIQLKNRLISSKLIRQIAVKELLERSLYRDLNKIIMPRNTTLKLLLQSMILEKQDRNYANIGNLTEKLLCEVEGISDTDIDDFYNAKKFLEENY